MDDVVTFVRDLNLVRDLLTDVDAPTKTRAPDAVRTTLEPHQTADGVLLGGACWLVTAAVHG